MRKLTIVLLLLAGLASCKTLPAPVDVTPTAEQVQATRNQAAKLAVATKEALTLAVEARRTAQAVYEAGGMSAATMQAINSAAIVTSDKALAFIDIAETVTTDASLRVTARELLRIFDGLIDKLTAGNQNGAAIRAALAAFLAYLGVDDMQHSSELVDGKCPYCLRDGLTSTVTITGCSSTLLAFIGPSFDEDGKAIPYRDLNRTTCSGTCSRGHSVFTVSGGIS